MGVFPVGYHTEFSYEWNEVTELLKKSGKDLSNIPITPVKEDVHDSGSNTRNRKDDCRRAYRA